MKKRWEYTVSSLTHIYVTGLQQNGIKMGFCQYYGNDPATLHGVQLVYKETRTDDKENYV